MADRLLCFVLMPFGMKKDPSGGPDIDFDHIYEDAIGPGIKAAGMEPVRADEVRTGGIAYDAMFERLLLCDFAVADLTTANAYVSYGLGVRHTARPGTTLTIFSSQQTPPFDLNYMRALPYRLGEGNRFGPHEAGMLRTALAKRLEQLRSVSLKDEIADSPVFHLIGAEGYKARDIARLQTDVFRDRVQYSVETKRALADARESRSKDALVKIEESFKALDAVEEGVLVDLFLSYRAVQAWDRMIELYERLPASLQRSVMLREQLAFALNRSKRRREAIEILEKIASEQGPSSETNGLLGRVYKDLWLDAVKSGQEIVAKGYLDKAIAAYVRGFEADWRDAYPGINALTLLDIKGDEQSLKLKSEMLPIVRYAVTQRLKSSQPDYWDYVTMLELAVLDDDEQAARRYLSDALLAVREQWEPLTTANNLTLIRDARRNRSAEESWLDDIIGQLQGHGTF